MNLRLAATVNEALARLGTDTVGDWSTVAMVKSDGPVAPPGPETSLSRGFNLLLLSPQGRPAYYVRCRAVGNQALRREAGVLQALSRVPGLPSCLPDVGVSADDQLRVMATRFVDGRLLARLLPRMSVPEWLQAVGEVARLARALSRAGLGVVAGELQAGPRALLELASPSLETLRQAGVGAPDLAALADLLRGGGALLWLPQHADLWPGNVMRTSTGWVLLDFEHFGLVGCPLYDTCHLLHTSADYLLAGGRGLSVTLAEHMRRDERLAAGVRQLLVEAGTEARLDEAQMRAAFAYHLVDMTARLLRNGVRAEVTAPLLRETLALAGAAADPARYFGAPLAGRAAPGS